MATSKKQIIPGLPADPQLAGDFLRVTTATRSTLGIPALGEEEVMALARETGGRMLTLPPEVSLADRNALLSLFDEVSDLTERLGAERAVVKKKLQSRARHGQARKAYQRGTPR